MPAIPVVQPLITPPSGDELAFQPRTFERGDKVILVSRVQVFTPKPEEIEEFAFSKELKSSAPNENLVWLRGQYVEADRANANGAQWTAGELSIKSLTPMLMPVTVMHDPRTAVGTIADVKLRTPAKDNVPRARIDTVLALWGHRFPEAIAEAQVNAKAGTLMQSMECYSPWYSCSECGSVFHKLPRGAEQAQWCDHLKRSNPTAGFADLAQDGQSLDASRILGDVCFTGTGLIFGTRGARGAYSEAHLHNFEDEVAAHFHAVHSETGSTVTPPRSEPNMGAVQIEQSELDLLRKERDDARAEKAATEEKVREAEAKVEQAEAKVKTAEEATAAATKERDELKEEQAKAELKETRMGALGTAFTAKLGDTTKTNLTRDAQAMDDTAWDSRLAELEEAYAVKRDAKLDGKGDEGDQGTPPADAQAQTFSLEEIAKANGVTVGGGGAVSDIERAGVVGSLASAFKPKP